VDWRQLLLRKSNTIIYRHRLTLLQYYGATIFESAGIDDPILVQLILGAINVGMTFFGIYSAEKFGRRWPLIIGGLWQTAWLLIFASVGTAIDPEGSSTSGIVMIVSACMFIASFAVSWGPLGWVVVGEVFPLRTRAKQASLATASNWLANCRYLIITLACQC
jgi:MFS transporter, SP family, sugar:H+ symporter